MRKKDQITLSEDLIVEVEYDFYEGEKIEGDEEANYAKMVNHGEVEILSIKLIDGELLDFAYFIEAEKNWSDWIESKIFEIND